MYAVATTRLIYCLADCSEYRPFLNNTWRSYVFDDNLGNLMGSPARLGGIGLIMDFSQIISIMKILNLIRCHLLMLFQIKRDYAFLKLLQLESAQKAPAQFKMAAREIRRQLIDKLFPVLHDATVPSEKERKRHLHSLLHFHWLATDLLFIKMRMPS